jgi:hypothetical protein
VSRALSSLHVEYKIAASMETRYLQALEHDEDSRVAHVAENLRQGRVKSPFLAGD